MKSGMGRGPSRRSGTDWRTLGRSRMGRETLGEVRDGSENPRGGSGRFEGPLGRSAMGRWILEEVRDGPGTLK